MTPPRGACVWCAGGKFTREHVIGEQFVKRLGWEYPVHMHVGEWSGTAKHNMRVVLRQRVCETCNVGWMRRIDNACISIIGDCLAGYPDLALSRSAQRTLATWATKIALLLELYLHDWAKDRPDMDDLHWLPSDNFTQLYEHQRPSLGTQVWVGATDPREGIPAFSCGGGPFGISGTRTEPPHEWSLIEPLGYVSVFVLGNVVFHVFGRSVFRPEGSTTRWKHGPLILPEEFRTGLLPIWPPQGRVAWPPKHRITRTGLGALSASELASQLFPNLPRDPKSPPAKADPFAQ